MEAVFCIIFSVFAVYGLYTALRECIKFIDRIISRRGSDTDNEDTTCDSSKEDAPPGCMGCGCCFWEEIEVEDDDGEGDSGEDDTENIENTVDEED